MKLLDHFSQFGVVTDVKVVEGRGFGFMRFETHQEACRAIFGGDGMSIMGKVIRVGWGREGNIPSRCIF